MDKELYKKNRHSCYILEYHLVLVTKYRHPVIKGRLKEELIKILVEIIENRWECEIKEINTDKDHVHILFEAKPQVQLSKLVNNIKTISSRLIRRDFAEELKPYYWKPYFWSESYFIGCVSEKSTKIVQQYIRDQGKTNPS